MRIRLLPSVTFATAILTMLSACSTAKSKKAAPAATPAQNQDATTNPSPVPSPVVSSTPTSQGDAAYFSPSPSPVSAGVTLESCTSQGLGWIPASTSAAAQCSPNHLATWCCTEANVDTLFPHERTGVNITTTIGGQNKTYSGLDQLFADFTGTYGYTMYNCETAGTQTTLRFVILRPDGSNSSRYITLPSLADAGAGTPVPATDSSCHVATTSALTTAGASAPATSSP